MEPLLEPPCAASQGFRPHVFRNYTSSPKERDGCLMIDQPLKVPARDFEDEALRAL